MSNSSVVKQIDLLEKTSKGTYLLALGLSLASRIDAGLIRQMRLEVAPRLFRRQFPVQCESKLWFGPWVASRDDRGIRLGQAYANEFRERLWSLPPSSVGSITIGTPGIDAATTSSFFDASCDLLEKQHAGLHHVFQLEERLVRLSMKHRDDPDEMNRQLQVQLGPAIQSSFDPKNRGLDTWLLDMSQRLPDLAQGSEAVRALQAATNKKKHRDLSEGIEQANFDGLETVVLDVRRTETCYQIGYLMNGGTSGIEVPNMDPIVLDYEYKSEVPTSSSVEKEIFRVRRSERYSEPRIIETSNERLIQTGSRFESQNGQVSISKQNRFVEIPTTGDVKLTAIHGKSFRLQDSNFPRRNGRPGSEEFQHELSMDFSNQSLNVFPEEIFKNPNVQFLDLSANQLSEFDVRLKDLKYLIHLDLSNNQIDKIPEWVFEFEKLESLVIDDNQIIEIRLPRIEENQVDTNGAVERFSSRLRKLSIRNNKLQTIPSELGRLRYLTSLDVDGNLFSRGTKGSSFNEILNELREESGQARVRNNKLPLYLMGNEADNAQKFIKGFRKPPSPQSSSSSSSDSSSSSSLSSSLSQDSFSDGPAEISNSTLHVRYVVDADNDHSREYEFNVMNLTGEILQEARLEFVFRESPIILLFVDFSAGTEIAMNYLKQISRSAKHPQVLLVADSNENSDVNFDEFKSAFDFIRNPERWVEPGFGPALMALSDLIHEDMCGEYFSDIVKEADRVAHSAEFRLDLESYFDSPGTDVDKRGQVKQLLIERGDLIDVPMRRERVYNEADLPLRYVANPVFVRQYLRTLKEQIGGIQNLKSPWAKHSDLDVNWSPHTNNENTRKLMMFAEQLNLVSLPLQRVQSSDLNVRSSGQVLLNPLIPANETPAIKEFRNRRSQACRQIRLAFGKKIPNNGLGQIASRLTNNRNENVTRHAVLLDNSHELEIGESWDDVPGQILIELIHSGESPSIQITAKGNCTNRQFIDVFRRVTSLMEDFWRLGSYELYIACPNSGIDQCNGEFSRDDLLVQDVELVSNVECDTCHQPFDAQTLVRFLEVDHKFPVRDEVRLFESLASQLKPKVFVYSNTSTRKTIELFRKIQKQCSNMPVEFETNLKVGPRRDLDYEIEAAEAFLLFSEPRTSIKWEDSEFPPGISAEIQGFPGRRGPMPSPLPSDPLDWPGMPSEIDVSQPSATAIVSSIKNSKVQNRIRKQSAPFHIQDAASSDIKTAEDFIQAISSQFEWMTTP